MPMVPRPSGKTVGPLVPSVRVVMLSPCTQPGGSANAGSAWLDDDRDRKASVPDLRQLRAFVAVAEELNFTRAAERLVLGQAAVSRTVAALERDLGAQLLERTSHAV